jgi:Lantibiotic dehydratase, N terminus
MPECLPFTLAPVGILRAATRPIEDLNEFGDRSLAKLALGAIDCPCRWEAYLSEYNRVFDREREYLMKVTVRDLMFRKAIRLSNPIVSAKLDVLSQLGELPPRNKMSRRIENTLYRYLARSLGRTNPNGLWAGVSLVEFTTEGNSSIEKTAAEYYFAPDLRPFQQLLQSLGKLAAYRKLTCWRVNPTLLLQGDGCWHFWRRTGAGEVEQRVMASNDLLAQLFNILMQQETATFAEFIACIQAELPEILIVTLEESIQTLADEGILQGGLDLPQRFSTVWTALSTSAQLLLPEHQVFWNRATRELQACCQTLSERIETIELTDLETHLLAANECVITLAQSLNIKLDNLPNPILHCDLKLPVQVKFDRVQQELILKSIDNYQAYWLDGIAPTTALRQDLRQQLTSKLQPDLKFAEIAADTLPQTNRLSPDRNLVLQQQLGDWDNLLQTTVAELTLSVHGQNITPKSPLGCLYLSPCQGFQLQVRGIDDDPARGFARFGKFLDSEGLLHHWLKQNLTDLQQRYRVIIADLEVPFEVNPNVLCREIFGDCSISLWKADRDTPSLRGAKLSIDATTSLPFLKVLSLPHPLAVFGFSAAHVSAVDPLAELLFYTGFQERPIAIAMAATVPTNPELANPRSTPRIYLPEGSCIRPQRTVLTSDVLFSLTQTTAAQRYAQWQQLAVEHRWSELLMLQVDSEPPLLMRRDSPLALESIFKSVRPHTQWLVVEETIDLPWLVDAENRHYLAEIAFPLRRSQHAWSSRA